MYGLPIGVGGFIRIPAGNIPDVVPGKNKDFILGKILILEKLLMLLLKRTMLLHKCLDSHIECPAFEIKQKI